MRRAPCPVLAVREDHHLAPREAAGGGETGEEVIVERLEIRTEP
jgi:hypothetical protein